MPRGMGFPICGTNLREPALLDHDQGGFETPRQRRRSNAWLQPLPPFGQLRVINRCACSELLGFDDERFDAGPRLELLRPSPDALLRLIEPGRGIGVLLPLCTQRGNLTLQNVQSARRGGGGRPLYALSPPHLPTS